MYSGTTFTNASGAILGAHQKIDRVAYKHLQKITSSMHGFPTLKQVLYFEGKNGPDGIKRKSPARDEPWHFYNPFDDDDTELIGYITRHYDELVAELKKGNMERAAFNAAWLAHSIVDGLTPAHHFPYEEKISELRGEGIESRTTIKDKLLIPGDTIAETIKKNWAIWGSGGVMSMHVMFEMGVAIMLAPLSFPKAVPSEANIQKVTEIGYVEWFERSAREIALLDMYDGFYDKGWNVKMARQVRNHLGPVMIKTVCLAWFCAARDAGLLKGKK
ncbi:hypothetical protein EB118_06280 [bacterium]|nr:hypothetical protein [bacterium]NBX98427.1 hypothetical protein [bacterium]NDC94354.1 hypothetical protein [bacterium]NDD83826.1 hypothetical protein [bacterium]NDG29685.1 hypothetical protein [bacterium]